MNIFNYFFAFQLPIALLLLSKQANAFPYNFILKPIALVNDAANSDSLPSLAGKTNNFLQDIIPNLNPGDLVLPIVSDVFDLLDNLIVGLIKDVENLANRLNAAIGTFEGDRKEIATKTVEELSPLLESLKSNEQELKKLSNSLVKSKLFTIPLKALNQIQIDSLVGDVNQVQKVVKTIRENQLIESNELLPETLSNVNGVFELLQNTIKRLNKQLVLN